MGVRVRVSQLCEIHSHINQLGFFLNVPFAVLTINGISGNEQIVFCQTEEPERDVAAISKEVKSFLPLVRNIFKKFLPFA
jgi:hypothetical protein